METIMLRADLQEALEKDAQLESRSVNDIVNEAVERYLREQQRAKLDNEIEAYEAMHPEIKKKHFGQWVAVHNRQLVDHDPDRVELYRRVRVRYGRMSVLIRQVREQPVEEIWVQTPK
ncbi:MAG: DUF5678 domain-containing protein [Chloroflexota bacterium]